MPSSGITADGTGLAYSALIISGFFSWQLWSDFQDAEYICSHLTRFAGYSIAPLLFSVDAFITFMLTHYPVEINCSAVFWG